MRGVEGRFEEDVLGEEVRRDRGEAHPDVVVQEGSAVDRGAVGASAAGVEERPDREGGIDAPWGSTGLRGLTSVQLGKLLHASNRYPLWTRFQWAGYCGFAAWKQRAILAKVFRC